MEIVINMHGGVIQEIFAADQDLDIKIIDWDTQGAADDEAGVIEVHQPNRTLRALVSRPNPSPLYLLAGTEVEAVIEAAEQQEPPHGEATTPQKLTCN